MPEYRFWNRNPQGRKKPAILGELLQQEGDTPSTAKLYLYDPIDSWGGYWGVSAKEFVEALGELPSDVDDIRLHINSPGGEVYEGIAINNALRAHPARVTAVVDGVAASAASFIASGADEVVMGQSTELMIHDAWGFGMGPAVVMRDLAERLDKISNTIASIYQRKAGGTVADWRELMLAETWFSDREAVEAGLADRVDGDEPEAPDDTPDEDTAEDTEDALAFDRTRFRYQGRSGAPAPAAPAASTRPARPIGHRMRLRARKSGLHLPK